MSDTQLLQEVKEIVARHEHKFDEFSSGWRTPFDLGAAFGKLEGRIDAIEATLRTLNAGTRNTGTTGADNSA